MVGCACALEAGAVLTVDQTVARSENVVVRLPTIRAFRPGCMLDVEVVARQGNLSEDDWWGLRSSVYGGYHRLPSAAATRSPGSPPRQWELLRLVAAGLTNAQIADQFGVAEGTVRIHLGNIYERLHVSSRTAAATRAFPGIATA